MIKLDNVSKIYPVGKNKFSALQEVNLSVRSGEFVAIKGASGSGKSTLLNIIGCLDYASSGAYYLDGRDVSKLSDEKKAELRNRQIGFVLQDFALINDQTVLYNVMLPLLLGKTPYAKIRRKAVEALNKVGIEDQLYKKVNQLSGGQRQRVAIARAIITEPNILLADEPTGQLDTKTGEEIMKLLKILNDRKMTVIVATHDGRISQYANRVLTVADGRVIQETDRTEESTVSSVN